MQRQPISFLLGIFLLFSLPSGIAAQVIRVGYPSLATGFAASWVTADKGIRKKHGLEVELIYLRSGSRTVAALTVVASTLGWDLASMFTPPSDMISEKAGMRILAKLDVANVGGGINTTPAFVQKNRPQAEVVRALIDLAALDFPQAQKLTEKDNTDLSLIDETQRLGFIDQLSKN